MDKNPYATPPPTPLETSQASLKRKQPLGVSIVSVMLTLPGIATGILLVGVTLAEPEVWRQFAAPRAGSILAMAIMLQVGVVSGIGIWLGGRWAWHLALLYCALPVYMSINGWVIHGLEVKSGEVALDVIHVMAASYLCLRRPRDFFGVSKTAAFISAFGACVGSVVFYHAMTWIALPLQWAIDW